MAASEPKVTKSTGLLEPFREPKLRRSLARSGASHDQIEQIVAAVRAKLHEGITTNEVYRIAHRLLRGERRHTAARYSLQRAIQRLGPDGFPFENFIAELWRHDGFRARSGVLLQGRFVRHELDLVADRGGERELGECKFKVQSDGKVDVKVALYVHSRAEDLDVVAFRRFWLITNGRFTSDALTYGKGVGLAMLSWDHPKGDSLRERIDRAGLHPITVLTSLHHAEQAALLRRGVVLCAALRARPGVVDDLGLGRARAERLWREIDGLCGGEQ
ncbi:MAG TPA: ATP cone domain-containing protein [Planctomycetota bacterium]|nr:ATP cone domain-containing protein [Planctomycetota bacterium]